MSYIREIPRDLFNEANLLKCYGRIYINLETAGLSDVELKHDGEAFNIEMDFGSGGIFVSNVVLYVRGRACDLIRPLNSRESWPLYMIDRDECEVEVFDQNGDFSAEMMNFFQNAEPAPTIGRLRP